MNNNPFPFPQAPRKNINLGFTFPSAIPDMAVEIKKGRNTIALTQDELDLLAQLCSIYTYNGLGRSGSGPGSSEAVLVDETTGAVA